MQDQTTTVSLRCVTLLIAFCFSLVKGALDIAEQISKKSPVAVQGTKASLVFSRDHSVQEGLDHIVSYFYRNVTKYTVKISISKLLCRVSLFKHCFCSIFSQYFSSPAENK